METHPRMVGCICLRQRADTNATYSSGDTGVSASLILHGTPPFQVYYRTQRDNEVPRDLVKTFTSSRGIITLQPEHSGHYFYTFLQLSDANYKKVLLDGPGIDQVVHPLAAADFVLETPGQNKKVLSSCSGSIIDVDVDLRVSECLVTVRHSIKSLLLGNAAMEYRAANSWSTKY